MALKVLNRCSGSRALNRARSSDTLPQENTGPGLLIGDTHCEAAMLSPAGLNCEQYQVPLGQPRDFVAVGCFAREATPVAVCCYAAKQDVAPQCHISCRADQDTLTITVWPWIWPIAQVLPLIST